MQTWSPILLVLSSMKPLPSSGTWKTSCDPNPFPIICVTSACLSTVPKKSFSGQCVQPVASGFQTSFELWQKPPVLYECHFHTHQALRWSSSVRWHLGIVPDIGLCFLICLFFYFLYSFSNPSSLAQALCGQFLGLVFCLFAGFLLHNPKSFQSLWVCGNPTVFLISNILSLYMSRIRRYILFKE